MAAVLNSSIEEPVQARVGELLRERVMAAEPGDRLSEVGLAREFGVSRTLVRHKTSELAAEGLIVKAAGRGIFVTDKVARFNALSALGLSEDSGVGRSGALRAAVEEARVSFPTFRLRHLDWSDLEGDVRRLLSHQVHVQAPLHQSIDPVVDRYPDLSPENFRPEGLEIFRHDGKLLALPLFYSAAGILCNRTLFEEAGISCPRPDWTWQDMIEAARALHRPDRGQTGMALTDHARLFLAMIWSFGGEVLDESRQRWSLRHAAAYRAAGLFARLRAHGVVETPHMARALFRRFAEGRIAMFPAGGFLATKFPSGSPDWARVAFMPRGEERATWVFAEGVGLGRACRNLDLAAAFIHGLAGAAGQKALFDAGLRVPGSSRIGGPALDADPYLVQMPWARVSYCISDAAVRGVLSTRLAGLDDADSAEGFCHDTEELINGVLAARRHESDADHG